MRTTRSTEHVTNPTSSVPWSDVRARLLGYTPGVGNVIEGFAAIADARGRPHRCGEETGIAGLYFVGFKNPTTGALREIALEAPRVARSIRGAKPFPRD